MLTEHTMGMTSQVRALTKPDAQHVSRAATMLKPYQDEKLEIYNQHHKEMANVFHRAREARGNLQDEYDRRSQSILDRLAAMRSKTDKDVRRHIDRLKEYSNEFDNLIAKGKTEWCTCFEKSQTEIGDRISALNENMVEVTISIQKEHEDCEVHTESETGPVLEQLKLHRDVLDQHEKERQNNHADFCAKLEEHFSKLEAKLRQETYVRKKQYKDSNAKVKSRYASLNDKLKCHDKFAQQSLDDLRDRVRLEKSNCSESHETVVHNMMNFMEEFEKNTSETHQKQLATQKHLERLRSKLREEDR